VKPRRTDKQKEIMGLILRAAGEGRFMTVTEIHEAITYDCTYGAIRVSLRFLEGQDMIAKQRDGRVCRIVPTQRGYDWFRPRMS
jgi:hypothetical protein